MVGSTANPREATASQAPPAVGQVNVTGPTTNDPFVTQRTLKAIRSQITRTCSKITSIIQAGGSRGAIQGLVNHAKSLLDTACQLQQQLIDVADVAMVAKQHDIHLTYVQQVGLVESDFREYLERRKGDPATEASSFHGFSTARVRASARSRNNPSQQQSNSSDEADAAVEALQQLELARRNNPTPGYGREDSRVRRWVEEQQLCRNDDSTPDAWIDLYRDGRLQTIRREFSGTSSSIKAELGDFNGKALEWFEKLAILKSHLRGDVLDVVYGLGGGGGEAAYAEALGRLKENYGRKDIMRAALMQTLENLSVHKQDPSSFRRFAEKTRTFLFDLSRIGESATADVIERICLKLPFADRLAWNTDRGSDLERRSLNEFGNWLCQRAMAYQNAYTIAAEQSQDSQPRPKVKFATRSHAANADSNGRPSGGRAATPFYCFKCEGRHPLETCAQFKELTSKDRLLFCMRHKLCFNCFATDHTSRECKIKKHCNVTGCKHWHHELLHDVNVNRKTAPVRRLHGATQRGLRRRLGWSKRRCTTSTEISC
ncbi:hypothetical protein GHT06_016969 [Daphnia sinensis]|uniref:CCHC-type domain-containing protein n=1 Tax=Daphnia sinensis TaxID=1820382 RepID=A0AAD5PRV1_9CRUS|nr:hypothetical protein GHT06_016969 [Daphnia sinensis]